MEACSAVEKEQLKVYGKLQAASESTSRKLKSALEELAILRARLKEGNRGTYKFLLYTS